MPRGKALSTQVRELAKSMSPDQMRQLAELLAVEAEKPRVDVRMHSKLQRAVKTASAKLAAAEEALTVFLADAGKTNDEINAEISEIRRDGERAMPAPKAAGRRGGRRKKTVA